MTGQGEMVTTSANDGDTIVVDQPIVLPEQGQEMREDTPWPQPPVPATGATNRRTSPTTTNCGHSSPQWAGAFGACNAAQISAGGANFARSSGSIKHLVCECESAGGDSIGRWPQSLQCPCP